MSDSTGPEDYRCRACGNLVLYRSDHQPSCEYHPIREQDRWVRN